MKSLTTQPSSKSLIDVKRSDPLASACRHCKHYVHEGRRGGNCGQLNVLVQGSWKACSLASPVFAPNWQFERIMALQSGLVEKLQSPISKNSDLRHEPHKEVAVSD